MSQRGFWDEQERISKLHNKKPILKILTEKVPWQSFSPLLDQAYEFERKSPAGRKRINPLILFKMLILQQLFNLSDSELDFQVNDRRSFEEFIGFGIMDTIPDATTVAFFRERLRKASLIEELFERFEQFSVIRALKQREARLLTRRLFRSQYNEIHAKRTTISRMARSLKSGKNLQNACTNKILTQGGLKEMAKAIMDIKTESVSMSNTESSADMM
jgi:transposase